MRPTNEYWEGWPKEHSCNWSLITELEPAYLRELNPTWDARSMTEVIKGGGGYKRQKNQFRKLLFWWSKVLTKSGLLVELPLNNILIISVYDNILQL